MNEAQRKDIEEAIATAWEDVESRWEADDAHKKFIELCATLNVLDEAGRRYRAVRDHEPDKRDSADKRIDQLLSVAMRNMEMLRAPDHTPKRNRMVITAIGIAVALMAIVFILTKMGGK